MDRRLSIHGGRAWLAEVHHPAGARHHLALLMLAFRCFTETVLIMLSVPFALVGGVFLQWLLGYSDTGQQFFQMRESKIRTLLTQRKGPAITPGQVIDLKSGREDLNLRPPAPKKANLIGIEGHYWSYWVE